MDRIDRARHLIRDLLARRRSSRALDVRPVEKDNNLGAPFEAARRAASCFNEQPWRFIVARRENGGAYDHLPDCLVEGHQFRAQQAPASFLQEPRESANRAVPQIRSEHLVQEMRVRPICQPGKRA